MNTIHYSECPVCSNRKILPLMTIQDHSVSKENFVIWVCQNCSFRFTQDVPDEDSIGRYYKSEDYISHSESEKGLINKLYKQVRKLTLKNKSKLVESLAGKKGSLLDYGAGTGAFVATLNEQGWRTVGLEPDAGARNNAKIYHGVDLLPLSELDSLNQKFDVITLWHVLEHVHQLHPTMDRLRELLTSDGKLVIALPNHLSYDARHYGNYWAAYDVPRHLYHFNPQSVRKLAATHRLNVTSVLPMWFDSYYISLLSSRYRKTGLGMLGAYMHGNISNLQALMSKEKCSSLIYVLTKS